MLAMSRIAVVCIVLCLALWGIHAASVATPTNQTPAGGEASYAVDLYRPSTGTYGFLDVSPIQLGNGKSTTIEIEVFARSNTGCILSMGDQGTDNYVALQINGGNLFVRVGAKNLPNSVAQSTGSQIQENTWTTLSVVITNNDASSASVTAYANGVVIINGASTRALTSGTRTKVLIGRCQLSGSLGDGQGPQELNGIVDNFRVWDLARSLSDIQAFATLISTTVDLDNPAGLIVHFPFVEGVGATSIAYAGQIANNFYVASFKDAVWVVKNAGDIYRTCASAGDPHIAINVPGQAQKCFDPPHIVGQWQLTSCGDNFIVRTYHAPVRAWDLGEGCDVNVCGATINNAFTVRAFDDVFYVNTQGYFFIKKLYETSFSALSTGAGVRPSGTRYNIQSNKVFIEVPTAGYLNADILGLGRGGTYNNIYIYHTRACETLGVNGLCAKQDQRVTWNQFLFLDNATPLPSPGEVPARDHDPCTTLPPALSGLKAQAEAACSLTIDQTKFEQAYLDCIFDVCASGDISVVTNINDDGSCRLAEILAAQSGQTAPACGTRAQCPNACSGHGTCGDNGCTCASGYVGPDCSRPASFPCFNIQDGHNLPLNPWVFQSSTIDTLSDADLFTFWNTWHTEDGVLIYFAKIEASQNTYSYNLFVSNDAPNADGGAYTLTITGSGAWYESIVAQGTGVTVVSSDGASATINFAWDAFRANGVVFKNIDTSVARTLNVQTSTPTGIRQYTVGANSLRSELDVMVANSAFTLTSGICVDTCAAETDCEVCSAREECGWCRSSGQCFLGTPSGPRSATCKDWKFSTDDLVARRLTASFGYPVNPDTNTAYLPVNAKNTLDVDLFVSMGNKETIKWDMALVLGVSGLTNADDRTNWLVDFGSLTSVFRLFPNLGFSLGTYNSVNTNKFTLVSALVDAASVTSDVLRSWVYGLSLYPDNNNAATSALATLTDASFGLNWRTNTRRMITIYVDQLPVFGTDATPTPEQLRQTLLNFRVLPVFLATPDVQAAWEGVVATLRFGLVIPVQADSGDLSFAITKAINLATSQISLITDLTSEGHVVGSYGQSVTGLSSNMRARFSVPFKADSAEALTTKLIAPGFGSATVTNVMNDSPLATIQNIKLTEDNFDADYKFNGTVFRLAGLASNGVDPILAQVIAAPTVGGLYQFDVAGPKPANLISTAGGAVFVNDPQGRVIYLSPPDASAVGDQQFDSFAYRVRDACAWSSNVTVRVDVIGVNDRPWTQMAAPLGDEDIPVVLTFKWFDREGDEAQAYVSVLPYDVLVTGEQVPRGLLYQYSEAVAAGNTVGAVVINAGDAVIDNRAVYIPWANANTEKKPEVLYTQPYFTYNVKETTCCKDNSCNQQTCTKLTSWNETVQIFLRAVNDAPVIIKDSDLSNYNFTATPCFSDCTFLEDNGARYPDLAQPVQVWLGGGDIELDQLKAVITALELPATASLTDLSGNNIAVGSVIGPFSAGTLKLDSNGDWFPVGTLFPALRFIPGLDENNNANGYYAKVTYKVNDGDKDSVDTKTITIRITPVNDLPRSTIVTTYTGPVPTNQPGVLAVPHVITLMNTPANFSITGTDPEGDLVTPVLNSCLARGGKVEYLNGTSWVTLNCSRTSTLPTKPSGSTWLFRYTPPRDQASDSLQVLTYQLEDGSGDNKPGVDNWVVTIDVIAINQAPTLTLDNNPPSSNLVLSSSVGAGLPLNYNLTLVDPDVLSGTMLFTAQLTCLEPKPENCGGRIVVTDIASGQFITKTNTTIVIKGMIFDLQVVLSAFNFVSAKMGKYSLNVTINDNGNLGVCPLTPGSNTIVRFCPREAVLTTTITVDDSDAINTIVIASVAGAAAAAGIAVAAGFASRLNKKAQSAQYTPWEINDMDRGISNPLHESPTVEMSNPLHEGPEAVNE
eukprot:TRINITY_DN7_c0_g1_i1.p1 TRINITY_DN7_c0_g1~~TRINITY_DN7_c0_g1_i1.p1  ORF type:complete len:1904 (-),score=606.63 TRINITY_DN7_c0_g1_i1:151-5862(-)